MKFKLIIIVVLSTIWSSAAIAEKSKRTWDYPFAFYQKFRVKGSEDFHIFEKDLQKDEHVLAALRNNEETGVISYLLYYNGKILIDEQDIPETVQGGRIVQGLLPSHSMGKSLVSYVAGHAICEGYIENVAERLTDWDLVKNTLFENQKLIDILNMQAGDDNYVGERLKPRQDNILKSNTKVNVNTVPLRELLLEHFQGTKPASAKKRYNYSALATNVAMNYVIYRTGNNWENLLQKVFAEHVKVKNEVYFYKTIKASGGGVFATAQNYDRIETGRYSFLANRYDYLRIGKAILEDWNSDTCIGRYLRSIYDQRIVKNDNVKEDDDVGLYTKTYGGQFHFDLYGLENRKIIGLSGFAGQQMLIDVENERIIVVNSLYKNYDWRRLVYDKIK